MHPKFCFVLKKEDKWKHEDSETLFFLGVQKHAENESVLRVTNNSSNSYKQCKRFRYHAFDLHTILFKLIMHWEIAEYLPPPIQQ